MSGPMLVVANDAVSKLLQRESIPTGFSVGVPVSSLAGSETIVTVWGTYPQADVHLSGGDNLLLSGIYALALQGVDEITPEKVMKQLGYKCATSRTARSLRARVERIIRWLSTVEIELSAADGRDPRTNQIGPWLSYIPRTPLVSCEIVEGVDKCIELIRLLPNTAGDPVTALPLLMRAREAHQVINITHNMIPSMRMTFEQRIMALELTVRKIQKLTNKQVPVEKLFAQAGYSFAHSDAGRHARARAKAALIRVLEALASNHVLDGYELEYAEGGRRLRAIDLLPTRAPPTILPLSTANNTDFQDDLAGKTRISA